MSREHIDSFNLVMIIMMLVAFRLHLDLVAYVFSFALLVGCLIIVYIDVKAIKKDPPCS
jgi:hypothetical protein